MRKKSSLARKNILYYFLCPLVVASVAVVVMLFSVECKCTLHSSLFCAPLVFKAQARLPLCCVLQKTNSSVDNSWRWWLHFDGGKMLVNHLLCDFSALKKAVGRGGGNYPEPFTTMSFIHRACLGH